MDSNQLNGFRRRLVAERQRLLHEISDLEHHPGLDDTLSDSISEFSTYDNHPADIGTETFERSKDLALRENTRIILNNVQEALDRMEAGEYGICQTCGREIELDRLDAVPYATQCASCAEEHEEQPDDFTRPIEEKALYPPSGRSFRDDTDNNAYDGEDAWQEVARYGTANSPQDVPDSVAYGDSWVNADEDHGLVEQTDGLIDLSEIDENVLDHIYPDPSDPHKARMPHPQKMRGTRPGPRKGR
ncbi:MAG: TraR/DksA C4-type zinc finger protein [Syntrophothermus sp.]